MHDVERSGLSEERITEWARELTDPVERERTGRFLLHGVRFVIRALEATARIEVVLRCRDLLFGPGVAVVERLLARRGVPVVDVSRSVIETISDSPRPQGLSAIARQRWTALDAVRPVGRSTWIALQSVRSPGNLGTLLRTAEAAGAAGLVCLGRDVDPYDPAAVRPTMGSLFGHDFVRTTIEKLRRWADEHDVFLIGSSGDGDCSYDEVRYPARTVVVLGDERKGLSRRARAACDLVTRIPMAGTVDSLNLAVAGSLLLYEILRQGRRA